MSDALEALFQDENIAKSNYWKAKTPGDKVAGYLVDKKKKPNTLKPGTDQWIYTLMQKDGTTVNVAGRVGSPQIIPGFDTAKIGQLVGVKYIEDKPHPKAGYNAIKVVRAYLKDEFAPELVEQYKGAGFSDTSGSGEPF